MGNSLYKDTRRNEDFEGQPNPFRKDILTSHETKGVEGLIALEELDGQVR